MRITSLAEHGVICSLHLARRGADHRVTGREIAHVEQISADTVEQILLKLRRAGIVQSTRGTHGGYALARPAAEISIRDIISAAEATPFVINCDSHPVGEDRCSTSHSCSIRPVWMLLQRKIDEVLDGVKLSDLLSGEGAEGAVGERIGLPEVPWSPRSLPVITTH
jgi:Rrf2 family iron-sulfur cluster assembly transcriptional regulator